MSINKLENLGRTDREQTENRQTENSKPEATLIPVDSRGERANIFRYYNHSIMILVILTRKFADKYVIMKMSSHNYLALKMSTIVVQTELSSNSDIHESPVHHDRIQGSHLLLNVVLQLI